MADRFVIKVRKVSSVKQGIFVGVSIWDNVKNEWATSNTWPNSKGGKKQANWSLKRINKQHGLGQ